MSSIVKNIIIIFTLACAAVLIVFCIELVTLNVDSGKGRQQGQQLSDDQTTEDPDENENPDEQGAEHTGDTEPPDVTEPTGNDENSGEQSQPPEGIKHELPMHDDEHVLTLHVSEELFEYTKGEDGWWFTYKGEGEAKFEIVTDLITPPGGITALVESLLVNYLDGGDSEVGGNVKIANSSLRGNYVTGEINNETYEGWVIRLTNEGNSGKAVDIIINYQNEEQKGALYDILDTLELNVLEVDEEIAEEE